MNEIVERPVAQQQSHSEFIVIRGKNCHIRRWGNPDAPLLFLLHGWMDVSATFQFMALRRTV